MTTTNNSYVYALLDPRKPGPYRYGRFVFAFLPFYVGKGTGKRAYNHLKEEIATNKRKASTIRSIRRSGLEPIVSIKKKSLSNDEAFLEERKLVQRIGRLDVKTGPLTNLNDGGIGGPANRIVSRELREKLSDIYWAKDENTRKETARKRSNTLLSKSDVEKARISKKLKASHRNRSEEDKQKRASKSRKATTSFWSSLTPEQRAERCRKISEGKKRHWESLTDAQRKAATKRIREDTQAYHRSLDALGITKRSMRASKASLSRQLFK